MSQPKIGVGIIGLSAERGWAMTAHLPALRASADYEVVALCASSSESARAASAKHGVTLAFGDHRELMERSEVDLVVITVRVPDHRELVAAAIDAGKPVLCEWPLARDAEEAQELRQLAEANGVRGFVGLQARSTPAVRYVKDLVEEGHIGEVLSTTMIGSGDRWGATVDRAVTYLLDRDNGATMLTIPVGHAIDGMCFCLGEIAELSATTATRRPTVAIRDSDEKVPMSAEDQIALSGTLTNGAVFSVHYRGGRSSATGFLWEIEGTKATIVLTGRSGHLQYGQVELSMVEAEAANPRSLAVPESYRLTNLEPGSLPFAVGQEYALLSSDLHRETQLVPTFADGERRHLTLAAVEQAAVTGKRQRIGSAPH